MRGVSVARDRWDAGAAARHPLAWPIDPLARRFADCAEWPELDALNDRLADAVAGAARFVPCPPRRRHRRRAPVAPGDLYDGRIVLSGEVPTRLCSWHDFFNALVWAAWPAAKRCLHQRQHEAIAARLPTPTLRLPAARTPELDALAMLDEGGVVLLVVPGAADAVRAAVAAGDEAGIRRERGDGRAELLVFGHALYDHLRGEAGPPRIFVRPAVVVAPAALPDAPRARLALADAALARALAERRVPELRAAVSCDLAELSAPSTD